MNSRQPGASEKKVGGRLFYGRSLGPLAGPWIACLTMAGAVLILETKMPVFHEVVQIFYFILAVVLVIASGRWFQIRPVTRDDDQMNADSRKPGQRSNTNS